MNNTKYRWNSYCLYDYRGVEDHLSAMAAKGWQLERAGNTFWKYRREEPARVRYAVTYSADASQFNPGPTQGQQSLEELCGAAGWTKVSDWFQMQIFSTRDPNAVPLETDETLRLACIHRAMRKNFLPSCIVILLLSLWMSSSLLYSLISGNLYRLFENNSRLFSGTMFLLLAALEVYTLQHYYRWRRRSLRSLEEGGPCAPLSPGYRRLNIVLLVLVALLMASYLLLEACTGGRGRALFYVAYLTLFALLVFLVRRTTSLLRRFRASKNLNIILTLAVDAVLAFTLVGSLVYGAVRFDWFFGVGSGETYIYRSREWDANPREDLPLTLAELTGERYDHVRRRAFESGSFFLPQRDYSETALFHDGPKTCGLYYSIYEPRFPRLYQATLNQFLERDTDNGPIYGMEIAYLPDDPAPWGAEAAYRRHINGTPMADWLLCYPGRLVDLDLDEAPTEAQKELVFERLGA